MVLCGVISSYLTGEHPGPANYVNLLSKTAMMQGFNALDEWGRFEEAFGPLRRWEADGRLVHRQTIYDGIESCVDAMNGLFTGVNIGKMLVKIANQAQAEYADIKGVQTDMIFNLARLLGVGVTTLRRCWWRPSRWPLPRHVLTSSSCSHGVPASHPELVGWGRRLSTQSAPRPPLGR